MLHALVLSFVIMPTSLMIIPLKASDSAVHSNQLSLIDQTTFEEGKKLAEIMLRSSVQPEASKESSHPQTGCPSQWPNASRPQQEKGKQVKEEEGKVEISSPQILVFVSFSMPLQTLKELAMSAEKYNAKLVIRGLVDNSFKKTMKKLFDFQSGLEINPNLFKTFNVKQVPTFISLKEDKEQSRLSGNVSLSYAVEKLRGNA